MRIKARFHTRKRACLLGKSGGMPPQEILNLEFLRLLLMQSGTRSLINTCDKTIITMLNFKVSGGGGGGIPAPPPGTNNFFKLLPLHMCSSTIP